jgi:hypothetical protein
MGIIDTQGIIRAADVNADYTILLSVPKFSGSCERYYEPNRPD